MEQVTLFTIKEELVIVGDPFLDIYISQCPPNIIPTKIRNPDEVPNVDKLCLYQEPDKVRIPVQMLYWMKGSTVLDKKLIAIHPEVKELLMAGVNEELRSMKAEVDKAWKEAGEYKTKNKLLAVEVSMLRNQNEGYASTNAGLSTIINNFVEEAPLWKRLWVALFPDKIYDIENEED